MTCVSDQARVGSETTSVRIRFAKHGKVRFTSHRDVARIWERALRRAGLPVAYSAGFTPRPKLSFGPALSTGYSSDAEYLDVCLDTARLDTARLDTARLDTARLDTARLDTARLDTARLDTARLDTARLDKAQLSAAQLDTTQMEAAQLSTTQVEASQLEETSAADFDEAEIVASLTAALPTGMTVLAAAHLPRGEPSLQQAVTSCTWRIDMTGADHKGVSRDVDQALSQDTLLIERERKGRRATEDIRAGVLAVEVREDITDGIRLVAELGTQPRAVRPAELLASLDLQHTEVRVCRLHQWIATDDGGRREPLTPADGSGAAGPQQ